MRAAAGPYRLGAGRERDGRGLRKRQSVAAHRKPQQRPLSGTTPPVRPPPSPSPARRPPPRFDGTGHAEPQLTPAQVKAKVDKLYQEAEVATEKYNGAKEKADKARERARHAAGRGRAQDGAAQLRAGRAGFDRRRAVPRRRPRPRAAARALLRPRPVPGRRRARRAGRQPAGARGRRRTRDSCGRSSGCARAARASWTSLKSRQAELKRHKKTSPGSWRRRRAAAARLTAEQRARLRRRRASGRHAAGTPRRRRADRLAAARRGRAPGPQLPCGARPSPSPTAASAAPTSGARPGPTPSTARAYPGRLPRRGRLPAPHDLRPDQRRPRVSRSQLAPGDLVFFYSGISHVGLYVGDGQMIHAPNPSAPGTLAPIDEMPFAGATRVA